MKTKAIGVFEAKSQLSKLIEEVEATGKPITITRHGKPVAELGPVGASSVKKRVRGCGAGPGYSMAPDFDAPLTDHELEIPLGMRAAEKPPSRK